MVRLYDFGGIITFIVLCAIVFIPVEVTRDRDNKNKEDKPVTGVYRLLDTSDTTVSGGQTNPPTPTHCK